jgi:pimeloyl-ACP methyl ester carboxylesterase
MDRIVRTPDDRPGYGGSTAQPGRTVADCAADVRTICAALGISRLAMWGLSGGGPRVLACAALLPGLVTAAGAYRRAFTGPDTVRADLDLARRAASSPLIVEVIIAFHDLCLVGADGEWFMGSLATDGSVACWASYGSDLGQAIKAL